MVKEKIMKEELRVIVSGGGTGGHIYPAIAIANEIKLRFPEAEVLFVGALGKMEMQKVPEVGYPIIGLPIMGIQRKLTFKNLAFPMKLLRSLTKARKVIKDFKPDVVIGTGGYASGPLLRVASKRGIPTLIQEQNSLAGITNRLLGKKVDVVCVAYPGMEKFFPKQKIVETGNPLRQDLLDMGRKKEEAKKFFDIVPSKKVVLVLGGSLGARRINQLVEQHLEDFETHQVQLLWQTGSLYYEEYKKYEEPGRVQTFDFLRRMDLAFAAADIIISRAGAGTVSELAQAGKPVVFIPSPNVAEDHQTRNAQAVVSRQAAVLIPEADLKERFKLIFFPLLEDQEQMERLGQNFKKMARPDATSDIVDEIEKLLSGKYKKK